MKKIYESPNTIIVKINTQQIIAASPATINIGDDYDGEIIQAHRTTLWGDDE